jgi:hypothetical protein
VGLAGRAVACYTEETKNSSHKPGSTKQKQRARLVVSSVQCSVSRKSSGSGSGERSPFTQHADIDLAEGYLLLWWSLRIRMKVATATLARQFWRVHVTTSRLALTF